MSGNSRKLPIVTGIIILAAILGLAAFTPARNAPGDQAQVILTLENAWNQAEMTNDAQALEPLLADRFAYTEEDGNFWNKQQFLAHIKKGEAGYEQLGNTGMHVELFGSAAVVTGDYHERLNQKGKVTAQRGRFTDVWVLQDGQWKCAASQSTLVHP
jgi:hypothetical protein